MGTIKPPEDAVTTSREVAQKKMYVVSDSGGIVKVKEVPPSKNSLMSDNVCIVDAGLWVDYRKTNIRSTICNYYFYGDKWWWWWWYSFDSSIINYTDRWYKKKEML
jgi:hypothetical protein